MKRSIQLIISLVLFIGIIFLFNFFFGNYVFAFFGIILPIGVISVGLIIFLENRHPSSTLAWLLVLALNPLIGLIFYFSFGREYKKIKIMKEASGEEPYPIHPRTYSRYKEEELPQFSDSQRRFIDLAEKLGESPISYSTETKMLINGTEKFAQLIEELSKAVHHIHMEYYIYRDDEIGTQIKNILVEKAKSGVEVRFLYDDVGSLQLSSTFIRELRAGGVKVAAFNPVRIPVLSSKMNYRNHRKIVVIDGRVGFLGGINIGDEYLGNSKKYGFWRDTHVMLRGGGVNKLQLVFLRDWLYMTGEKLKSEFYLSTEHGAYRGKGACQIIASGPNQEWKTTKKLFFSLITSAKRSIWIATPYFVPDEDIYTAIQVAALSGIDVKILFPNKPDKWIPFLASHSYFPDLIEAGVEVYGYEKGFMHSKIIIVDGEIASVGTVNIDMRSFNLNYEVSAFIYGSSCIKTLIDNFEADLQDCVLVDKDRYMKGVFKRLMVSAARVLSPLL